MRAALLQSKPYNLGSSRACLL